MHFQLDYANVKKYVLRYVLQKQKKEKPRKRSVLGAFLACLTRFERATYRVGVCHSIQLSYRHICSFYAVFKDYRPSGSESNALSS